MARVITFSDHMMFDKSIPTNFVQSFITAMSGDPNYVYSKKYLKKLFQLNAEKMVFGSLTGEMLESFHAGITRIKKHQVKHKVHTIRKGHRWEKGNMASPRVWFGAGYNTPQIILWDDVQIQSTYNFEVIVQNPAKGVDKTTVFFNDKHNLYSSCYEDVPMLETIAANDGLNYDHFKKWFSIYSNGEGNVKLKSDPPYNLFDGQVICWQDPCYK